MIFGPSYTTMAGAIGLSILISGGAGFFKGISYEKDKAAVALANAVDKARLVEQNWQSDAATIEEVHANELREVNASHLRDLAGLRARSARLPEASRATCNGSTGTQLSGDDAAFLVGFAAERDAEASDLRACQAWVKAVMAPR